MKNTKNILRISTRGYYDLSTGKKLKNTSYFFYPRNSFKKILHKKEITIMIHGLRNDKPAALKKFQIAKRQLKKLGYIHPVIGFSYDSNTKGAHIEKTALKALRVGQSIAKQNGNNLAKFIIDFKKQSPATKIRLIGHSLGTELIVSCVQKLAKKSSTKDIIEGVYFFGSSVNSNAANPRKYGTALNRIVKTKIRNYYSPSDEVLNQSQKDGSVRNPLGLAGSKGKTISKYSQTRVFPKNHRFASYAAVLKSFP